MSRPWLVLCQCFKQCRQNVCRHGRCFGSVYTLVHTGHETSSRRLWSNVLISMCFSLRTEHTLEHISFSRNWNRNNDSLWLFFCSYSWNQLFVMTAGFVYKPIRKLSEDKKHFNRGFLGFLALWNVKTDSPDVVRLEDVTKNEEITGRRQRMDISQRRILKSLQEHPSWKVFSVLCWP